MGVLSKIFRGHSSTELEEEPQCPHKVLIPHWETLEDIGKGERVEYFLCQACRQSFKPEELESELRVH